MNQPDLRNLERKIHITFTKKALLQSAFVHKSYVNEHRDEGLADNERLEFLGDAVLELVVTEFLYEKFNDSSEGELTTLRSALVKGKHLSEVARVLGLGEYLLLSRGEEKSGGREKNYILANTVEALIGAIHLDGGFNVAHKFIYEYILTNLEKIVKGGLHIDAKSKLQELSQEKYGVTPTYEVVEETGPDHNKQFEVAVFIGDKMIGKGKGSSKQNGENEAAVNALKKKI